MRPSPLALAPWERQAVLDTLTSPRFVDQSPRQVHATLLDEGHYLCSVRTIYRLLREENLVQERRQRSRQTHYAKPELLAKAPNQVWSWDITKLKGPVKWSYYCLYVVLDIYSRYVVGWMVADRESQLLAQRLLGETCQKQGILPGQLSIHADRGTAMTAKSVALLLSDLGVTKTHSRPHVSNDNPFSESHFKTLKYQPNFPSRFGSLQDARSFCHAFFGYYNGQHCHSGIAMLPPHVVHYGLADQVLADRQQVLDRAFAAHPERFRGRAPRVPALPEAVWINPPANSPEASRDASALLTL
jgi:putative transposase